MSKVHVTRVTKRFVGTITYDLHGHDVAKCDERGCSGDELYLGSWTEQDGEPPQKGDVIEDPCELNT